VSDPADSQEAVLRFLADPAAHGWSGLVARVDTANAIVVLAGPEVYKVKRAVRFPFMDLLTLDKRRDACEAEIAVNQDNAPGVYLEALPIVRRDHGFAIGGAGEIVEWVTHMRRFDESRTLDRIAEREGVSNEIIDRLALAIRAHARAPLRDGARAAHELETTIEQNDAAFAERPALFPPARRLTQDSRLAFAIARPTLLARGASGFVRRCHGDLHLRNIALIDREPTLFDAVEFSDDVASGDVLYDLAFLLMDLEERSADFAARPFRRPVSRGPLEARLARVAARRADASDADASVARWQRAEPLYERGWSPLDGSGSLDSAAASALRRIGVDPLSGVGYLPAKP
jgi:aminoglycoside phosphotransferase family enzyme